MMENKVGQIARKEKFWILVQEKTGNSVVVGNDGKLTSNYEEAIVFTGKKKAESFLRKINLESTVKPKKIIIK